jgi:hypothetical protein
MVTVGGVTSYVIVIDVVWVFPAPSTACTVIVFVPATSGTDAVQDVVPVAAVYAPPLFDHCTRETSWLSDAVPASATGVAFVANAAPPFVVTATAGCCVSWTTVTVASADTFPAVSVARALIVLTVLFTPDSVTVADHAVVPDAVVQAPPLSCHSTFATATLSDDVPPSATDVTAVYVGLVAGLVIATVGATLSYVTVSVFVAVFPAVSVARTSIVFVPATSAIPVTDQFAQAFEVVASA